MTKGSTDQLSKMGSPPRMFPIKGDYFQIRMAGEFKFLSEVYRVIDSDNEYVIAVMVDGNNSNKAKVYNRSCCNFKAANEMLVRHFTMTNHKEEK